MSDELFAKINEFLYRGINEHGIVMDITFGPVLTNDSNELIEAWAVYAAHSENERGSIYLYHTDTLDQARLAALDIDIDCLPFGWSVDQADKLDGSNDFISVLEESIEELTRENEKMSFVNNNIMYYNGFIHALHGIRSKMLEKIQ